MVLFYNMYLMLQDSPDEITASISLERIQSGKIGTEFPSVSDDVTRRTEIGSVTSIGDCSDIFDTDSQFLDANQDVVSIINSDSM